MSELAFSDSIFVAASSDALYALVTDIGRMGEWSPICTGCWWDEGDGPRVGAWFTGRNEKPERTWETRSQVVVADPSREFAYLVGGAWVRWGYTMEPVEGGSRLTESWEFRPAGLARFAELFGADADNQIEIRTQDAHRSIPITLAALKVAGEAPIA